MRLKTTITAIATTLAIAGLCASCARFGAATEEPTPEPTLLPVVEITRAPEPTPTPEPTPEPTPTPPPPITILVGGDVLTGEKIGPVIVRGEYEMILDADSAERFRNADVALINLETSVSTRGTPMDKTYTFRSPPENLAFLRDHLGVDVASLANNHALDYGRDAFEDTLVHMREYGIEPIGGGMNITEAAAPWIAEVHGVKIAFFASNQILPAVSWTATDDRAGQLVTKDPANLGILETNVRAAVEECDYVIVYMHWGIERDSTPHDVQKRTARALIDMGVDVVIGAHPHVIQSFEYYNGKPIIYSLGNFIFNSRNPETAYMELVLDNGEITAQLVPCYMNAQLTYAVDEERAAEMLKKWSDLSINAVFDEDGYLRPADE